MLQGMETAEQSYIFIPSIKKCQHMDSRLNALQACNGIVLWFAQWHNGHDFVRIMQLRQLRILGAFLTTVL